jgi:hypothetical protein
MPTPDPSLIPSLITTGAALFTGNIATFLAAAVAVLAVIVIPTLVARGALRTATHALGRVFRVAR